MARKKQRSATDVAIRPHPLTISGGRLFRLFRLELSLGVGPHFEWGLNYLVPETRPIHWITLRIARSRVNVRTMMRWSAIRLSANAINPA
jgi:hypothetical protein